VERKQLRLAGRPAVGAAVGTTAAIFRQDRRVTPGQTLPQVGRPLDIGEQKRDLPDQRSSHEGHLGSARRARELLDGQGSRATWEGLCGLNTASGYAPPAMAGTIETSAPSPSGV
jgi:hypothetical protein